MARTTSSAVEAILLNHYDGSSDLSAFIATATALVDHVASQDSGSILSATMLGRIEAFLSAHFYAHADQLKQSESIGRSSAVYQGRTEVGLRSTQYGQTAVDLDLTGTLSSLGKKKATMTWLGKNEPDQIDYEDRN